MPGARTGVSGREKVRAMKTVAMVTTPTPYHLPGSMWGPVPHTWCHSGVSALAQSEGSASPPGSLPRHHLDNSQGQESVCRVQGPCVHQWLLPGPLL